MEGRPPTLLTFAPMVDSEAARLVLRYHQVDYAEADHLFGWASVLTLLHGGYGRIPLLHGGGRRLTGPRPLAETLDRSVPPERRLIPVDPVQAAEVNAHWHRFNDRLALDVAALAYFHLLPARSLMTPVFAVAVPAWEARLLPLVYRPTALLFRLLLRLNADHARGALVRIRGLFDWTAALVDDGRPVLVGDRLTLADLALASASAPLLQPTGYGARLPAPEQMPPALDSIVAELRAHPTSSFVQRLYDQLAGRPTSSSEQTARDPEHRQSTAEERSHGMLLQYHSQ